ncbi:hypothetical protein CHH49_03375 [Terribacillus saccharophilus]|uniref:hypothetical protein n=1 Tax=Terribacillus saccharophilus TaxID=361277 RepID=UPI000BA75999|nr:hypothetical protein [Terribacillus saccharophilus]PAF23609.1 hypothetical protein CHH49_03375 [Terribacillus saccharophilus]
MKPERILTVEASDSLNFLLYVHNYAKQEKHCFPYIPGNPWNLQEQSILRPLLQRLWNETLSAPTYPSLPIDHQKDIFRPLFCDERSFESCLDTFYSWWGNMAGQMAIEHFIGDDGYNSLYTLFQLTDKEQLKIHLLYEDNILGSSIIGEQLVITLKETMIQEEMINTIQNRLSK